MELWRIVCMPDNIKVLQKYDNWWRPSDYSVENILLIFIYYMYVNDTI